MNYFNKMLWCIVRWWWVWNGFKLILKRDAEFSTVCSLDFHKGATVLAFCRLKTQGERNYRWRRTLHSHQVLWPLLTSRHRHLFCLSVPGCCLCVGAKASCPYSPGFRCDSGVVLSWLPDFPCSQRLSFVHSWPQALPSCEESALRV